MTSQDSNTFAAGQQVCARTAACVARLAALELVDGSRWWNRRRHRLMASALVACAEEMDRAADEGWGDGLAQPRDRAHPAHVASPRMFTRPAPDEGALPALLLRPLAQRVQALSPRRRP
jgi:hypothetical protein